MYNNRIKLYLLLMITAALGNPVVPDVYMYNNLSTATSTNIIQNMILHHKTSAKQNMSRVTVCASQLTPSLSLSIVDNIQHELFQMSSVTKMTHDNNDNKVTHLTSLL